MKTRVLLLVIFYILVFHYSAGQSSASSRLSGYVNNINRFNNLNPQEKVYLHFDNAGYYQGETIWFKAYIVFSENNNRSSLSKILHVELLSPEGEVINTQKLKIDNGECHGEFSLSKDYRSGFYEVRAYTRSMLNFGEDCVFSRVFPVYNEPEREGDYSEKSIDPNSGDEYKRKREKRKKVNLLFYPEGGNAIQGLPSKIAFKSTGDKGQDINIEGWVYNKYNEEVATFRTLHQGMGVFELIAKEEIYKVIAQYEGKKYDFVLTDIISQGYCLSVNNQDSESLLIRVSKSASLPYDTIGVSVSCRGRVYAGEILGLSDHPYTINLPKDKLPSGCLQISLFDVAGNVHAERLVFNYPNNQACVLITANQNKVSYAPFEKVQLELSAKNIEGISQEAEFSIAVRDAGTELHTSYEDNILTNLLLSSDIKGYIENPMQYFGKTTRSTRSKLDLLMMVQGWRRYNWSQMAGIDPFEAKHYAEEGIPVSGKVASLSGKGAKAGVDIMFWMTKDSASFHGKAKTDDKGNFYFLIPDSLHITGKWLMGLQASEKGKRKHYRIMLDRQFSPQGKSYTYYDMHVKDTVVVFADDSDSITRRSIEEMQLLTEVVVKARKKGKLKPDIVCDVENDINELTDKGEWYPKTVGEYLEFNVPAFKINESVDYKTYRYRTENVYFCYQYNRPETASLSKPIPDIFIEEVYRIHIYYKDKYAWKVVASGKCRDTQLTQPAVFIMVKLYDDGLHDKHQKGIRYTRFDTYSQSKEFFHADNSDKMLGDVDFRRTLYWNPSVKTNKEGKSVVEFYNNSSCRIMTISTEGLTSKGVPILTADGSEE